jgi:hypothetical protein
MGHRLWPQCAPLPPSPPNRAAWRRLKQLRAPVCASRDASRTQAKPHRDAALVLALLPVAARLCIACIAKGYWQ